MINKSNIAPFILCYWIIFICLIWTECKVNSPLKVIKSSKSESEIGLAQPAHVFKMSKNKISDIIKKLAHAFV